MDILYSWAEKPCSFQSLQSVHLNGISGLEHVVAALYSSDVRPLLHVILIHAFQRVMHFIFSSLGVSEVFQRSTS